MKYIPIFFALFLCVAVSAVPEITIPSVKSHESHWENCVFFFDKEDVKWLVGKFPSLGTLLGDLKDTYESDFKPNPNEPGCVVESSKLKFIVTNEHGDKTVNGVTDLEKTVMEQFGSDNRKKAVVLVAHEWLRDIHTHVDIMLGDALFALAKHENINLVTITIDWSRYDFALYLVTIDCLEPIGKAVAHGLKNILTTNNIAKAAIGDGLGAHIIGFVGKNAKLQYILALDPAGVCLSTDNDPSRIRGDDADYVEALHTNGLTGYNQAIGKYDHYARMNLLDQNFCPFWDATCRHDQALNFTALAIKKSLVEKTKTSTLSKCLWEMPFTMNAICMIYDGFFPATYEYPSYLQHVLGSEGKPLPSKLLPAEGKYYCGENQDTSSVFSEFPERKE